MPVTRKTDTHCIWFKHLPPALASRLAALQPNEQVVVLINGVKTTWLRMQNGSDGRPTNGIKVAPGPSKAMWEQIIRGDEFQMDFPVDKASHHPTAERPQLNAAKGAAVVQPFPPIGVPRQSAGRPLFEAYLFADYSGALDPSHQRQAIRVAYAESAHEPRVLEERFTRETLVTRFVEKLRDATERGMRMILGQDHQYSIPFALAKQIGLVTNDWRLALKQFAGGSYHRDAPSLEHARAFARRFNEWLAARGLPPYFYSATKSDEYGIPSHNPRGGGDLTVYRLCEKSPGTFGTGKPKSFNRVGDNGTVGGQTLAGLTRVLELIENCRWENIPLKCWPFDGLEILSSAYEGSHVLVEPYPSATRPRSVVRSDAEDARAAAQWTWETDRQRRLPRMLDLSRLTEQEQDMVRFEGWIVGHTPMSKA